MRTLKKLTSLKIAAIAVVGFFVCSGSMCASLGVWSPLAQQTITQYVAWANQYIGGVQEAAPAPASK
jgi:hypothetical protein